MPAVKDVTKEVIKLKKDNAAMTRQLTALARSHKDLESHTEKMFVFLRKEIGSLQEDVADLYGKVNKKR
jgi:hypothetical protein